MDKAMDLIERVVMGEDPLEVVDCSRLEGFE